MGSLLPGLKVGFHLDFGGHPLFNLGNAFEIDIFIAAQGGRISNLDGVSVDFDDWHFNVRPSNTEPLLRLNLEALDEETMERRRDEVLELIRS